MFGLYIHFPFCIRKCHYCDFLSGPVLNEDLVRDYLGALEQELTIYHGRLRQEGITSLKTIYLGGGTPTLLAAQQLVRVLKKCRDLFCFSPGAEITIEANPGTVDAEKLFQLEQSGVNRISIGIQSFSDKLLAGMGRIHTAAEAIESVTAAKEAGLRNISIDLMYGLPGQTLADWGKTLTRALALDIEHISIYGLKVERGTAWGDLELQGRLSLPEEEAVLAMRELADQMLGQGSFNRYEISNYARGGLRSEHNCGYWSGRPYLGLGLGASSDFWGRRFSNTRDMGHYLTLLGKGQLPVAEEEILSFRQRMGETMFLGLRILGGLDLRSFEQKYGVRAEAVYAEEIAVLKSMGLITLDEGYVRLSARALPIANHVFTFFV